MSLFTPELIEDFVHQFPSKHTIKGYRSDLNSFKNFLHQKELGSQWTSHTKEKTQEYIDHLENQKLSENSKRRKVQVLRVFFDYLIQKNFIEFNPLKEVFFYKKVLRIPDPPHFEEIEKFYEVMKNQKNLYRERNLVMFQCIYELGLQSKDFQLVNKSALSPKYMNFYEKKYTRSIPVTESLFNNLQKILQKDFQYFFSSSEGAHLIDEGLKERTIELIFKDVSDQAKIKMTPKSLRQACIIKWFQEGKNKTTIAHYLGIKDPQVLSVYESLNFSPYKQIKVSLMQ